MHNMIFYGIILKIKVGRPSGASNTVATTPLGTGATGAGIGVNSVPQGSGVTSSAKNQAQVRQNENEYMEKNGEMNNKLVTKTHDEENI